ncbi:hypothetical protein FLAG1_02237 [Fusarium langsethiae]|uniref:Uncharacterized protein n=1 Tax=Fusarium langsethiae TaxID=179993 RepID=A0A0M9F2U4_FUSLA|nr:hypothetical protein FLAG1_02237 [Fusarium langsethiae]GKU05765.1 unnamed protein product [Fusarium langsethiae]GKU11561.1 unnamed protein product [Fusarium langsethiae]
MGRCEYYDAAPINKMWVRPGTCITTVDHLLSGLYEGHQRLYDPRLTGVRDKKRDKISNGLEWLLERGANGETYTQRGRSDPEPLGHMNTNLLLQLQQGTSKRGMEAIFNMIKMLSIHGYPNPTRSNTFSSQVVIEATPYHDAMVNYSTASPLNIALKSHVIPSVLELILSEHTGRGIKLKDWYDVCPASLAKLATEFGTGEPTNWTEVTYIHKLIGIFHADLHSKSTQWEESYFSEVADIFQAKLKLMIKYDMIDTSEEALLKSIEAALYYIAAGGMPAGRYDEEHFKTSWEKLWDAVRPFAIDASLVHDPTAVLAPHSPSRIHRFAINAKWNPWEFWYQRQDKARLKERHRGSEGMWTGTHHSLRYDRASSSVGVSEWHTVSMEEWCSSFPRSG